MKRMYITVGVAHYVIEEWAIDIENSKDPEAVFQDINKHPNNFFYDYDPALVHSEHISDEIQEVIEWRKNDNSNS